MYDLTTFQALYIKYLRTRRGCTWRRLSREFTRRYPNFGHGFGLPEYSADDLQFYRMCYGGEEPGPNETENHLLGMDLHKIAADYLGEDMRSWDAEDLSFHSFD